jgi:hypothetical protein
MAKLKNEEMFFYVSNKCITFSGQKSGGMIINLLIYKNNKIYRFKVNIKTDKKNYYKSDNEKLKH